MCKPTCEAKRFGEVDVVDDVVAWSTEHPFDDECHHEDAQEGKSVE